MAHTYVGKSCRIHHNGDYSGDVTIVCETLADAGEQFQVDMEDIIGFVAECIRSEIIGNIEQLTPIELLKLKAGRFY